MPLSHEKNAFRVYINGRNFLLNIDGVLRKMGFFTTRFVFARDAAEAKSQAVEVIEHDPKWEDLLLNTPDDLPLLHALEIEPVDSIERNPGYAFYRETSVNDDVDAEDGER